MILFSDFYNERSQLLGRLFSVINYVGVEMARKNLAFLLDQAWQRQGG